MSLVMQNRIHSYRKLLFARFMFYNISAAMETGKLRFWF